jgi:hypothetical protein
MEGDYAIVKKDSLEYSPNEETALDTKFKFRNEILRKIFLMGKLYNNVFVEIVRDTTNTKALNILDSSVIEPITEPNGDPISFKSRIPMVNSGEYPKWSKNDITWIKFGDRTQGFAPVDFKALWENLLAKSYVKTYVAWLWKTGQYRLLYNFTNADDKSIEDFLTYARKHDGNFSAPLLVKGELETKILRDMKETESYINLLNYYDNQTLILLRVPPVDAGIPDSSGRSNADAQSNNLITAVTSFKKVVEDCISFDLFPKINMGNTLLRFAPADRFSEKQLFEVVQIMQSLGMKPEVMSEYLKDRGMFFKEKELFNPQPDPMLTGNPRSSDMMPSRKGKGAGEGNKPKGTVSTRPDQIKKV